MSEERKFPEEWYTEPQANAADQVREMFLTMTGQMDRKRLSSWKYKHKVKDIFGNEVEVEGEIFGGMRDEE